MGGPSVSSTAAATIADALRLVRISSGHLVFLDERPMGWVTAAGRSSWIAYDLDHLITGNPLGYATAEAAAEALL